MSIERVLNALPRYKQYGKKWRAPCPVHDGKDLNLMLSERSDGSVGGYCFVCGANAVDVALALGLDKKEVFSPDSEYRPPVITREMEQAEKEDKLVVMMSEASPPQTLADKRRVKLAHARLEGIQRLREKS